MSIRQPKPKQIRLPFNVPKPKKGAAAPARVCGICRRNDSNYICPRCNIPYCSLACFRDQAHTQCSEPFYRNTVLDTIAQDPKAELDEKRKMMDMLRRFEEAAADGDDVMEALKTQNDDDDDELAGALEGVDLDSIDSNALLQLLPKSHRDAFFAAIQNPESEEAKALLDAALEEGDGEEVIDDGALVQNQSAPTVLPWWEEDMLDGDDEDSSSKKLPHAPRPPPIDPAVIQAIKTPPGVGFKLAYNLVAITLAYLHTLLSFRLPSLAPNYLAEQGVSPEEVKREISTLVPFLVEPKSTVRYATAAEAWGAVWESITANAQPPPTNMLISLLEMAAPLLHPPITTDPPAVAALLADLYRLFAAPKPTAQIPRKVAFYLAAISPGAVGRMEWLQVERQVRNEIEKVKGELEDTLSEEPERPVLQVL